MEYKKGYGPEMITGLAKVDGLLVGVVANQQGVFPNYPEYKMEKYGQSMGAGGKLYRQGLIKMNEFVTLCARDVSPWCGFRIPPASTWATTPRSPSCWVWASP